MSINNIGCELAAGYNIDYSCLPLKPGGAAELYLIPNIYTNGYITTDKNDKVTFISINNSRLWYRFQMMQETGFYTEKKVEDQKTGSIFWDQSFTILFHKNEAVLRKQMLQFMESKLTAVYKDNNGKYFLFGLGNGLTIEADTYSGKELTSMNGQTIVLKGLEKLPAYEIVGSAVTYSITTIVRDITPEPVPYNNGID